MPGITNADFEKQRTQYLNMRGTQIAENQSKGAAVPKAPAKGSRKQLIGTVVGILATIGLLVLLAVLDVI